MRYRTLRWIVSNVAKQVPIGSSKEFFQSWSVLFLVDSPRGAGSTGAAGAAAPPALVARGQHGGSKCPFDGNATIALDQRLLTMS